MNTLSHNLKADRNLDNSEDERRTWQSHFLKILCCTYKDADVCVHADIVDYTIYVW